MAIPWKSGGFLIADPCNLPFLVTIERQFIYRSWRPGTRVCCCRRGVAPRPWRQAPACPVSCPPGPQRLGVKGALLPGYREPAPILRLRYQGSAGRWTIGIYLASSGQYTETELPTSFGRKTGTPEEGVDDTFVLYAGPESRR
jgi:hypothetical protein